MNTRLMKILVSAAVVAVGVGVLVLSSLGSAQYYKMVDELMAEPASYEGKDLRVHGWVKPGSINEDIVHQQTVRDFILEAKGKQILVRHSGPKPDTFRDQSEVVAEGRLVKEGDRYVLEATKLMAKCPSKYEGAAANKNLGNSTSDTKPVFD